MNDFTYWSVMYTYKFATKSMVWEATKLGKLTEEQYTIITGDKFDLNNKPQN